MRRLSLAAASLALAAAVAPAARSVDLIGTWHVLVHYRDSATLHPERERWEDRIWEFSAEGGQLQWVDYPIVVFSDQTGRFENLGGNRARRVLHFWEPNDAQLAQIREGLEINSRGSRTKTLRGSVAQGWTSAKRSGGYQSARIITYSEVWSIDELPDRPVFTFDAVLGSATTESFQGRTRYETESVAAGGRVLRGRYDRDGARIGTFRMTRAGDVSTVKGSGKSTGERVYELFLGELGGQLFRGELPGGGSEEELRAAIESGDFSAEDRRALRLDFERSVADSYRRQGNDPRAHRPQIQSLARQMTALFVEEGKSIEEIREMLKRGTLRP